MAKMVVIDGGKLDKLLGYKGLAKAKSSREMGYNGSYLNECIYHGKIAGGAAKMLEVMYGIMLDDYIYTEPPKPEPEQLTIPTEEAEIKTAPTATLDITALQEAVALALTSMKTDYDALRGAIREGILDAIYAAVNDADTRNAISGLLTSAHLSALQLNLKKVKDGMKK